LYDSKYKPAIYNRIGYVNIPSLIEKTEQDIIIARTWKMGDIKEYKRKTSTEVPFKK
jgi:competence protein ComGF